MTTIVFQHTVIICIKCHFLDWICQRTASLPPSLVAAVVEGAVAAAAEEVVE
jgi:hypothetical protein